MKNNKINIMIIVISLSIVIGLCIFLVSSHKETQLTDAEQFKEEFEMYNGLDYDDAEETVIEVSIPSDNPIIYKTPKEIVETIKSNEKSYILFGYSTCPETRNIIETLLEVAKEKDIAKIYYVDIKGIRDEYKFNGSIIPEKVKDGTNAYYDIVKLLNKELEEYYVSDENGNRYDTGVKRLESATFVITENKKIISYHSGTIDKHNDIYEKLTEEEKIELKNNYLKLFEK